MTLEFHTKKPTESGLFKAASTNNGSVAAKSSGALPGLSKMAGQTNKDVTTVSGIPVKKGDKNDWLTQMGEKREWMDGLSNLEFASDGIKDTYSPQQKQFLESLNQKLAGADFKVRVTAATTNKGHSDDKGGEHKNGLSLDLGFKNLSTAQQKKLGGLIAEIDGIKSIGTTQHEKHIDTVSGDPTKGRYLADHSDHYHVLLNKDGEATATKPASEDTTATSKPQKGAAAAKASEDFQQSAMRGMLMKLLARKVQERAAENGNQNPELLGYIMDMYVNRYTQQLEESGEAIPTNIDDPNDTAAQKLKANATEFIEGKGAASLVKASLQASGGDIELAKLQAAQAFLETGGGKHKVGNNFFGIKGQGTAGSKTASSAEFLKGKWVKPKSGFRAYNNATESFQDYHRFLEDNPRYKGVLSAQTFEQKAYAISKAGYATDPKYAQKLITVYNTYLKPLFEDSSTLADSGEVKKS